MGDAGRRAAEGGMSSLQPQLIFLRSEPDFAGAAPALL